MPPLLWTLFRCHVKQVSPACSVLLHKQKYISPKKKPMPYQHFNALRSSRLAYKYFTEKWNQMSPAGAYLVKVRVPVNNSHRKSTQGCPTRWRWKFISDPGPIILLPCHSLTQSLRSPYVFCKGVIEGYNNYNDYRDSDLDLERLSELVTWWHSWLLLINCETWIMTLTTSDFQSDSDLDSIRNSCDVLILK